MKALFTIPATIAILAAGTALAADLPRRAQPPLVAPVPVFTWTGFYFGANAGYGFTTSKRPARNAFYEIEGPAIADGSFAFRSRGQNGFTGGLQVGANYQFTPGSGFVVGVEADAQSLGFGRRRSRVVLGDDTDVNPNAVFLDPRPTAGLEYFGTLRGRAGYAFDRTLVYATGGYAFGGGGATRVGTLTDRPQMRTGWTAGGGVEYALPASSFLNVFGAPAVTLKLEGLYVNVDRSTGPTLLAANARSNDVFVRKPDRRSIHDDFAVIRAGLNYKFGTF